MTLQELIDRALIIYNETVANMNSNTRVGSLFKDLAEWVDSYFLKKGSYTGSAADLVETIDSYLSEVNTAINASNAAASNAVNIATQAGTEAISAASVNAKDWNSDVGLAYPATRVHNSLLWRVISGKTTVATDVPADGSAVWEYIGKDISALEMNVGKAMNALPIASTTYYDKQITTSFAAGSYDATGTEIISTTIMRSPKISLPYGNIKFTFASGFRYTYYYWKNGVYQGYHNGWITAGGNQVSLDLDADQVAFTTVLSEFNTAQVGDIYVKDLYSVKLAKAAKESDVAIVMPLLPTSHSNIGYRTVTPVWGIGKGFDYTTGASTTNSATSAMIAVQSLSGLFKVTVSAGTQFMIFRWLGATFIGYSGAWITSTGVEASYSFGDCDTVAVLVKSTTPADVVTSVSSNQGDLSYAKLVGESAFNLVKTDVETLKTTSSANTATLADINSKMPTVTKDDFVAEAIAWVTGYINLDTGVFSTNTGTSYCVEHAVKDKKFKVFCNSGVKYCPLGYKNGVYVKLVSGWITSTGITNSHDYSAYDIDSVGFLVGTAIGSMNTTGFVFYPYKTVTVLDSIAGASALEGIGGAHYAGNFRMGVPYYPMPCDFDYAHLIEFGQSLSVGAETVPITTVADGSNNFMLGTSIWNYAGTTLNPLLGVAGSDGSTGLGEDAMLAGTNSFSRIYRAYRNKDQKFITTSCGQGGLTIATLSGATYTNRIKTAFQNAKTAVTALGKTVGCPAIVWEQGEADYAAGTTKAAYKTALVALKNTIQDLAVTYLGQTQKPLFFVGQLGYRNSTYTSAINMAIIEAAQENSDIILLAPNYPVPDYNLHLSANGYRWYGEYIAKALANVFIENKVPEQIYPQKVVIDGKKVKVSLNVPYKPLVLDTWTINQITNFGFRVYMGGVEQTIDSVTLADDTVIITCAATLSGTIGISYGSFQGSIAAGNLRDSEKWNSLYAYTDDSAEISTAGNPIIYRPKDVAGNYLTGKKYPIQNWCSVFYVEMVV